jgi:predicted dehydrogenase
MSLKIGLIGTGTFGRHTVMPAIEMASGLELAAVYDASEASLREAAGHLSAGVVCKSAAELVQRSDIDLVYIAAPPQAHKELVTQVLAARKHIVCEKPFTLGARDAAELAAAAKKIGVVNAVDHEMRYAAVYRFMRERVQSGFLGNLLFTSAMATADYARNPVYESAYYRNFASLRSHAGGILTGHMCHFVDLFQYMVGGISPEGGALATMIKEKPELVVEKGPAGERVVRAGPLGPVDADDTIAVCGRLGNGAPGAIIATWSALTPAGTRWHLQGSEGVLIYQSDIESPGGLWGGEVVGATGGRLPAKLDLPAEPFPSIPSGDPRFMSSLVAAELMDVASTIDAREGGSFATFESECRVWQAIERWIK